MSFMNWRFGWICSQGNTLYGFNGVSPSGFELDHESSFPFFGNPFPTISGFPATNYGAALTRAIIYISNTMDHSFVMFFSDGGASPIYGTEITLYNIVRNSLRSCKGSCIYSFCYDVGIGSNPNFLSTCNAIGATYFSSTSPWLIAAHLQFWSWIRIFWTPCPC